MTFYGLRLEYSLEKNSNYIAWKDKIEEVLKDNDLKEFIDQYIRKPPTSDGNGLAKWNNCVAKVRQIIPEGFWDHIFSSLDGKETPYSMWKTLMDLFHNRSDHRKLALKEKLRKIKMEKGN